MKICDFAGPTLGILLVASLSARAAGQSFNIDINSPGSPPNLGGGVPSPSFGAASGQAGVWNSYPATSSAIPLMDITGAATGAAIVITATSTSPTVLAFNNPANTGDFALLLNDGAQIGTTLQGGFRTYQVSGLQNGDYLVYTYGARPQGTEGELFVNVVGSPQGTLSTTGVPMGNTFTLGVTHVIHSVSVTSGLITIDLTDVPGAPAAYVNGWQLVLIPGPGGLALLLAPLAVRRRRR